MADNDQDMNAIENVNGDPDAVIDDLDDAFGDAIAIPLSDDEDAFDPGPFRIRDDGLPAPRLPLPEVGRRFQQEIWEPLDDAGHLLHVYPHLPLPGVQHFNVDGIPTRTAFTPHTDDATLRAAGVWRPWTDIQRAALPRILPRADYRSYIPGNLSFLNRGLRDRMAIQDAVRDAQFWREWREVPHRYETVGTMPATLNRIRDRVRVMNPTMVDSLDHDITDVQNAIHTWLTREMRQDHNGMWRPVHYYIPYHDRSGRQYSEGRRIINEDFNRRRADALARYNAYERPREREQRARIRNRLFGVFESAGQRVRHNRMYNARREFESYRDFSPRLVTVGGRERVIEPYDEYEDLPWEWTNNRSVPRTTVRAASYGSTSNFRRRQRARRR